ncbi:acetyl-CoA carboxylase biotin carboxyl carrier protein subunit [Solwaraspora sp. WMMD791]|uniref:acetyl-CoA carboxylase biotin carboxyl carrier protein n=1 Tax=Solwaraspora sp. WMMD791 TaxID=3016086 RepID=UPI00249C5E85|nr:biotin/lipoyl-containing protein [Solwaraspora sp. WMMD791]WFE30413.1 acetyl-CoA carboxylase biotin carboxyl carrier protein subunit [Solwaraspora sp. WMMD791]
MTAASANGNPAGPDLASQLRRLAEQTRELVGELTGPLRRVQVRHGDTVIEIEWHDRPAPAGGAGPSLPDAAPGGVEPGGTGPTRTGAVTTGTAPPVRAVTSPIVGTFYRAAEPGGRPYVDVGDLVEPGQVIGIVEAMKLMNEIVADHRGVVVEVLVGDGEPVEFDQPLIALGPDRETG